VDRVFGCIFER